MNAGAAKSGGSAGVVVAALVGGALGYSVGRITAAPASETGPSNEIVLTRLDNVQAAIEGMQRTLGRPSLARESEGARSTESGALIVASDADLLESVNDVAQRLSAVEGVLKTLVTWSRELDPTEIPAGFQQPTQTLLVDELGNRLESEPGQVQADHFGWTIGEVYRKYGMPDAIYDNGVRWVYMHVSPSGKRKNVMFTFQGGVVVVVGNEQ